VYIAGVLPPAGEVPIAVRVTAFPALQGFPLSRTFIIDGRCFTGFIFCWIISSISLVIIPLLPLEGIPRVIPLLTPEGVSRAFVIVFVVLLIKIP